MAIQDGYMIFLGSDECAQSFVGPNTTVIDHLGRMAMAGLVDAHMHILSGSASLIKCNLNYQSLSLDEILTHVQGCLDG